MRSSYSRAVSRILSAQSTLDPAPDAAFVLEIFLSELALEIAFFAHDDDAIDEDEADGHGEEHPRGIDQDRQPKGPQSETDVHRVAGEAIQSVHDDARARIERDRISAGALLRNKSADVQGEAGDEEQRSKCPSDRSMHEAGRNKPFERKRREDRQDE